MRASRIPAVEMTIAWINGAPAARIDTGELTVLSLAVENGRVARIYVMRNPRKLTRLNEPTELTR